MSHGAVVCVLLAGLYTPASDIDLVLVNTRVNNPTVPLKALATALLQKQLIKPSSLQEILTARVPIIKFEMVDSGLCFDVCCDQQSGLRAVEYVRQLLLQWPALKPLALVLKVSL
jgi:non-canonical poly(A) RNA polymerase PAPD5/7